MLLLFWLSRRTRFHSRVSEICHNSINSPSAPAFSMSNRNQEFLCVLCCALATKTLNAWLVLTPAQLLAFFRERSVNRWGWTSKPDCHSGSPHLPARYPL